MFSQVFAILGDEEVQPMVLVCRAGKPGAANLRCSVFRRAAGFGSLWPKPIRSVALVPLWENGRILFSARRDALWPIRAAPCGFSSKNKRRSAVFPCGPISRRKKSSASKRRSAPGRARWKPPGSRRRKSAGVANRIPAAAARRRRAKIDACSRAKPGCAQGLRRQERAVLLPGLAPGLRLPDNRPATQTRAGAPFPHP